MTAAARTFALALGLAAAGMASANGRAPLTNGVYFQPGDDQTVLVRTTFGLLISRDAGCSFRWTCEDSIGYGGTFDPNYALARDGSVFATTYAGLRVSRDGGCSWVTATTDLGSGAPGRIAGRYVDAIDIGPTGEVWVATADTPKSNDVFRSTDNGVTFVPQGMVSSTRAWNSVRVAPGDPLHVYLAGNEPSGSDASPSAVLFSTVDDGTTWLPASLADFQFGSFPTLVIAAIDPSDAKIVYVTSVAASPPGDIVYRSKDGGATFAPVLTTATPITGFAILNATTVMVAIGAGGSYRSLDGGATFSAVPGAPQLGCLGQRSDGSVLGCAANWDPDFMAVASSTDALDWHKVFRFSELDGPLACPAGTVDHDVCDQQQWPTIRAQFGVVGPTCASATDLPALDAPGMKPPTTTPAGCCDAGDASGGGPLLLAIGVAYAVGRRGRRR